MVLRKNSQNVPKNLVFLEIAILCSADTKILSDFGYKHISKFLATSF